MTERYRMTFAIPDRPCADVTIETASASPAGGVGGARVPIGLRVADLGQTGKLTGNPFVANMKDVRTYLSDDLTPDEPTIAKARRDGAALSEALEDFNRARERVQA